MRRVGTAVLLLALCSGVRASAVVIQPDDDGKKLMGAATIGIAYLTLPNGQLTIVSDSLAKSAGGQVFRKLADCVYGLEEGSGGNIHLEVVDFSGLTGTYNYGGDTMSMGSRLTFAGRKPTTRCFVIAGNKGCQRDLDLRHMPQQEVQRVIDDVTYVLKSGCRLTAEPY